MLQSHPDVSSFVARPRAVFPSSWGPVTPSLENESDLAPIIKNQFPDISETVGKRKRLFSGERRGGGAL